MLTVTSLSAIGYASLEITKYNIIKSSSNLILSLIQVIMRSSLHQIVQVNGNSVENVTHELSVKYLQSNPEGVVLVVSREVAIPHAPEEVIIEVSFKKAANGSLGFSIAGGTDDSIEVRALF